MRLILSILVCTAVGLPVFADYSDLEESYAEILRSVEKQALNAYTGGLGALEKRMIAEEQLPQEVLNVRNEMERFERDGDIAIGLTNQNRSVVALTETVLAARRERLQALTGAYLHLLERRVKEQTGQGRLEDARSTGERIKRLNAKLSESKGSAGIFPVQGSEPVVGEAWTVPDIGMAFIWIPQMELHVGKYEVTNGEYRKMKPDYESKLYNNHNLNGDRQPVVYVNFDDAKAYAAWLTERERAAGHLPDGWQYRLPTETEWQTFARCGEDRKYPWGNYWPPKYGNYYGQENDGDRNKIEGYNDGFPVSCTVERSGENDWGLFGVGGNVWEATANDSGDFAGWRGASWFINHPNIMRVVYRWGSGSYRISNLGFRLVLAAR